MHCPGSRPSVQETSDSSRMLVKEKNGKIITHING
jgi:hypothetical protein